jgi:hypothetical protein
VSFRKLLVEALEEKVYGSSGNRWMDCFGCMAKEAEAVYEVDRVIDTEFSGINTEEWQ